MSKISFINIYHLLSQNWSQSSECSEVIEIGTLDISNMLMSIMMSKMIIMKYLPIVRLKLVPEQNLLKYIIRPLIRTHKGPDILFELVNVRNMGS